jgi:hypothetical protein
MTSRVRRAALALLASAAFPAFASEVSLTMLPNASVRYRADGKVIPQSYVDRFDGESSPVYRLEYRGDRSEDGYWSFALVHTGVFGGGEYAGERVPDSPSGTYQTNKLNVGFTNVHATWRRPLEAFPSVEALAEFTIARQIFKRKAFVVQGIDAGPLFDDVSELSAEGIGVGLCGRSSGRAYGRWEAAASHLVQIFDAQTDAAAGSLARAEAALGARLGKGWSVEAGGLCQYWFLLGQGNRRLHVAGTDGAVISWNRQETRTSGLFLTFRKEFSPSK